MCVDVSVMDWPPCRGHPGRERTTYRYQAMKTEFPMTRDMSDSSGDVCIADDNDDDDDICSSSSSSSSSSSMVLMVKTDF